MQRSKVNVRRRQSGLIMGIIIKVLLQCIDRFLQIWRPVLNHHIRHGAGPRTERSVVDFT
jgi:hypothetical protein